MSSSLWTRLRTGIHLEMDSLNFYVIDFHASHILYPCVPTLLIAFCILNSVFIHYLINDDVWLWHSVFLTSYWPKVSVGLCPEVYTRTEGRSALSLDSNIILWYYHCTSRKRWQSGRQVIKYTLWSLWPKPVLVPGQHLRIMVKSLGSRVKPGFKSCSAKLWLWASYIISLSLGSFTEWWDNM